MASKISISFIVLLFGVSIAHAEVVTLKSGKKVSGKIIERTDKYIKINIAGSEVYYENKYINNIGDDTGEAVVIQKVVAGQADIFLKEGLRLASEGKFDLAEGQFNEGLAVNKDDYNILGAQDLLSQLKAGKVSEDFIKYLFKGSYSMINEDYPAAIEALKQAYKIKTDDLDIAYNLGVAYYSNNNYDEAVKYLKLVVQGRPQDAPAHSYLGSAYLSLGQSKFAEEELGKAKKLYDDSGDKENSLEMSKILAKVLLLGR